MKGLVHDAALDAIGIMHDTLRSMKTDELGDQAVRARYLRQRGNPAAIRSFVAQNVAPDQVDAESVRYVEEMEALIGG